MTQSDEHAFCLALKAIHPALTIFDDNVWPRAIPTVVDSIEMASSRYVYIFPNDLFTEIPIRQRPDGSISGPSSGCVIQISRCITNGDCLLSGSIGTGWEDGHPAYSRMKLLWDKVIKITKTMAVNRLTRLFPETLKPAGVARTHWCFPDAAKWVALQSSHMLKDRAVSTAVFSVPLTVN